MRDPYEVLGIQRGATDDEIKKAYRAKCKRWHPDLNPNDPTAEEHFKEVQAAYDAITKGDTGPQMGGQPGGGYGYGQQGYYQGGYQQGYDQGYSQNGWQQGDFGFGFDPFGFGFGFGGYQQQSGASYSGSDSPEMQAARNFVANGRYAEARRVLDSSAYGQARVLLGYAALPEEIQTDGILHRALAEGKALYLPRCLDDAGQMAFYRVQALEELESGSFGVREPSLAAPQYNMDLDGQALCLVPGLCFDNKGYRLGYGKGYYDRFLAKFRGVTLGLCYNDFLQDCLPVGDYDLPVQQIATENRVFTVEQGAAYE